MIPRFTSVSHPFHIRFTSVGTSGTSSADVMDERASIVIDVWGVEFEKGYSHCNFDYVSQSRPSENISEARLNLLVAHVHFPKPPPDRLQTLQPLARPYRELEPVEKPVNTIWLLR